MREILVNLRYAYRLCANLRCVLRLRRRFWRVPKPVDFVIKPLREKRLFCSTCGGGLLPGSLVHPSRTFCVVPHNPRKFTLCPKAGLRNPRKFTLCPKAGLRAARGPRNPKLEPLRKVLVLFIILSMNVAFFGPLVCRGLSGASVLHHYGVFCTCERATVRIE